MERLSSKFFFFFKARKYFVIITIAIAWPVKGHIYGMEYCPSQKPSKRTNEDGREWAWRRCGKAELREDSKLAFNPGVLSISPGSRDQRKWTLRALGSIEGN